MDRDFDGRLSFEEFMGEESPIEKLFKNMDKNGDGLVTKQVHTKVLKQYYIETGAQSHHANVIYR